MSEIKSNTKRVPNIPAKKATKPVGPKPAIKGVLSQKFNAVRRSGRGR